jgi:hypothetical protein
MNSFQPFMRFHSPRIVFCADKLGITALMFLAALNVAVAATNAPARDGGTNSESLVWVDIRTLGVEGQGWSDTKNLYDRLPARAETLVRPAVWNLSLKSAGMLVRFTTDATNLHARWSLASPSLAMPNMAATGASGLDLYVRTGPEQWRWAGVGQPSRQTNSASLITNMPPGTREFLLYLPLFNGVRSVEIGVPGHAFVRQAGPWGDGRRKPVVFYGTSILNGISASRPGMVHSAILGRRFNWPTVNLGFAGEGKMEPELAGLLAELDPAVYVLDCLPNMGAQDVAQRVEPFVKRLRQACPATPIVLVEDRVYANAFLNPARAAGHQANHETLQRIFRQLKEAGVENLHYVRGDALFGGDGEGSVDGSHPSDLGYMRQAEVFADVLGPLLKPQ